MSLCPGCKDEHSDGVRCSKCSTSYCFSCANITEANYRKLGSAKRAALLCPVCKSSQQVSGTSPSVQRVPSPAPPAATLDLVLQELRDGIKGINVRLEQLPTIAQEIKDLKENLNSVEDSVKTLKIEVNGNIAKTLEVEKKTLDVEVRVSKLEHDDEYPLLQAKLKQLTAELALKEQRERMNNVEIKGVPSKKNENLVQIVCKLGEAIGLTISPTEINFVSRARASTNIKPIIVGFVGRYKKENFVAAARSLKNLTAGILGFTGDDSRVFINDHLTPANKQLLSKTKLLAKEKNHKFTWVQSCKILTRKNETSPIIMIQNEDDLAKIK